MGEGNADYCTEHTVLCEQLKLCYRCQRIRGKLTPSLNYRLTLTTSLAVHQPAEPHSAIHTPALDLSTSSLLT